MLSFDLQVQQTEIDCNLAVFYYIFLSLFDVDHKFSYSIHTNKKINTKQMRINKTKEKDTLTLTSKKYREWNTRRNREAGNKFALRWWYANINSIVTQVFILSLSPFLFFSLFPLPLQTSIYFTLGLRSSSVCVYCVMIFSSSACVWVAIHLSAVSFGSIFFFFF